MGELTLGSFFNGISTWILSAEQYGIKTLWESEIEDYCEAVTAHHFPAVKQVGDITKLKAEDLEPVDIITCSSPCQDLSVAGRRAGLEGERSGLFRTSIRLVHEMRKQTGKPRYFIFENVPGLFSSNKGHDFRAVLEEISQTEIPMPSDNRWAEAGCLEWGGKCSLAWRTLDAQYFGVPQRRKRIFLVADFGGFTAGEVLLECKSVYGDSSEGESKGQDAAKGTGASTNSTGWDAYQHHNWRKSEQIGPMTTGVGRVRGDTPLVSIYDMTHADEVMRPVTGDKSNRLNSRMGTGGNQVPVVHCIAGNTIGREPKNGGNHFGIDKDVSFTLNTIDRHAVCVGNGQLHQVQLSDKAGALNTMHDQQCIMYRQGGFADYNADTKAGHLRASGGDLGGGQRNSNHRTVGALCARDYKGVGSQYVDEGKVVIDENS